MYNFRIYLIGIGWFILSLFSSAANDAISKYTGSALNSFEVSFFRFFFSTLTLIPVILYYGIGSIRTNHFFIHIIRGAILFFGISAWTHGLSAAQLSTATVISFSIPLFTLALAPWCLKEKVIWQRWVATIIGFIGVVITLNPTGTNFNPHTLLFLLSAIGFAGLDIINKKFVVKETMLSMMFYSSLVTTALATPAAVMHWQVPEISDLVLFFILGISANLILLFLLKSFSLVDATAVAPYRYLELIVTSIVGYIIFKDVPSESTWYGAAILIPSTLFIIYSEKVKIKKVEATS